MKGIFVPRPVQPIGLPFGQPTNGIRLFKVTSPLFVGDDQQPPSYRIMPHSPSSAISISASNYQRGELESNPGQPLT